MYYYEALGDERFQEFCQALISASFPNVQCLAVGQPDGGRDAFLIHHLLNERRGGTADLIVFQVKYSKNAPGARLERDQIEELVRKEKSKVEQLKAAGLTKYYLLTNVKGTAHPNTGSVDKVNDALSKALGIEAYCWWRDDLDRRLDRHSSIKWIYPDILKATDLLEKLVAGQLGEDEERRRGAIRAYIAAQYDDEQELKFKQTDLRSTMVDLFVDLPMHATPYDLERDGSAIRHVIRRANPQVNWLHRAVQFGRERDALNSAEFFVRTGSAPELKRVVLEGAPGQGKSTVTQYLCQVLRMQLLDKHDELARLPSGYQNVQVRIPFRVDLRDLAKWTSGIDPFQSKPQPLDDSEPRSLEGFLAGQVRLLSGGHSFNVSDLSAIARVSHLLLALDGFDEVADVNLRQHLVNEIAKGTSRLMSAGGYSVQTIVTSRPAAFAKSVRFPRDQWVYFELLPLERRHIDEYTSKWTKAKGLKDGERTQLRRILDTKLREAHTQYLAKNPMQLTILLSLIHSRGASLPEKRTTMYDAYMDMFFSRESEKSDVVRENRDLLVDIHRYLAWKLQTSAEAGENGSIEQSSLRTALFSYLDREGEDTTIVDVLFDGIIERVGALVSRVQDTYEFEVQPLREYFAARHLYDTAPYPSDDRARSGDKFDRLRALVSNPYWLNVARFYGGCFNKGELLTLVNELIEFSKQDAYKYTSHPRNVALMLLNDWVFTQYQPATKQIVRFVSEYPSLRQLLIGTMDSGASLWSGVPERGGRGEFLEILWDRLLRTNFSDERNALVLAVNQISSPEERITRWRKLVARMPHDRWFRLGMMLHIYDNSTIEDLDLSESHISISLIRSLVQMRRFDLIVALNNSLYIEQSTAILLNEIHLSAYFPDPTKSDRLEWLASMCSTLQYFIARSDAGAIPLRMVLENRIGPFHAREITQEARNRISRLENAERKAVEAFNAFLDTPTAELATSIEPWTNLVEAMRKAWGDCRSIDRIAFVGAGIRSKSDTGVAAPLSSNANLVAAARYARLKSGAPRWWEKQLMQETSVTEQRRLLLLLLLWTTSKTLIKLVDILDAILTILPDEEWSALMHDFRAMQLVDREETLDTKGIELLKAKSCRLGAFIGLRLSSSTCFDLAVSMVDREVSAQSPEGEFAMSTLLEGFRQEDKQGTGLPRIQKLYLSGAITSIRQQREFPMPESVAINISSAPDKFPLSLVSVADANLRSTAGSKALKLLEVAQRDNWF